MADHEIQTHVYFSDFENKESINKLWLKLAALLNIVPPFYNTAINYSDFDDSTIKEYKTFDEAKSICVMFFLAKKVLKNVAFYDVDYNNYMLLERLCITQENADCLGISLLELKRIFREFDIFDFV